MAQYRLTGPAKADLAAILRNSEQNHGQAARGRYRSLIAAALRRITTNPHGRSTSDRSELMPGVRSFHIRHSRGESRSSPVGNPVHVIFYRELPSGMLEILRILHERMEPSRHIGAEGD